MTNNERQIPLIDSIKNVFKKQRIPNKGDLGIYHYVWSCDTQGDDLMGQRFDIQVKVKVLEVYDNLVEIEIIDIKINDSASQDIINIIKANLPKYLTPKHVRWILR